MAVTTTSRRRERRWIGTLLVLAFSSHALRPNSATIAFVSAWGFLPPITRTCTRTRTRTCTRTCTRTRTARYGNHLHRTYYPGRTRCYAESESESESEESTRTNDPANNNNHHHNNHNHNHNHNHNNGTKQPRSRITSIRCRNFAGMTGGGKGSGGTPKDDDSGLVVLDFDTTDAAEGHDASSTDSNTNTNTNTNTNLDTDSNGNLVCITGETGSGKSLLVAKIADLLRGGKATASMIHHSEGETPSSSDDDHDDDATASSAVLAPPSASVEMVLSLRDAAHVTFVRTTLHCMGLDPAHVLRASSGNNNNYDDGVVLRLKRVVSLASAVAGQRPKLKSTCFINDRQVTLKVLKAIVPPLVAIVNAPVAASALGRPASRLSMIDSGVPPAVLAWVKQLQTTYRARKRERQSLEHELEHQVLPASMVRRGGGVGSAAEESPNEEQFELLRHWIEELDGFERRISDAKGSLSFEGGGARAQLAEPELLFLLQELDGSDWARPSADADTDADADATNTNTNTNTGSDRTAGDSYSSYSLYETLLDLHAYLKALDARILAATEARDALASLSASDSARAALDRTRQLLLDAAAAPQQRGFDTRPSAPPSSSKTTKNRVAAATERAHEMLNLVEDTLLQCSNVFDDDEKGLVATLRSSRKVCSIGTEELLEYITEWNTLGRKHGVSPYQLPLCHETLKNELNGGVEAARLLPEAKIAEKRARSELREACCLLSDARSTLCQRISASITRRLPRLGMENSKFEASLSQIENPSYSNSHLGADEVDFYLLHDDRNIHNTTLMSTVSGSKNQLVGGTIETVASSGEKARILLAIECEIPGSISAIGGSTSPETIAGDGDEVPNILPVAVIYDEIDAHVGGRASISVAQMLFDQSKSCQVLSITHSPSLAAIADTHICVHRGKADENGRMFDVVARSVDGVERRKELARMASGDMVADEAEVFAEALLRDASSIKGRSQKLQPSD